MYEIQIGLNPHVVGRFFRAYQGHLPNGNPVVLIPMWWGGFSETEAELKREFPGGLNPHVVGRFFRVRREVPTAAAGNGLNPHVVGRFFRVFKCKVNHFTKGKS